MNRTSHSKTTAVAKVIRKERHNFLDDVELGVQEQKTTAVELGLAHRQYRLHTVYISILPSRRSLGRSDDTRLGRYSR
ncbi:MAG: ShlB/FhaC/HecB family hemolysin secretion/activation protein [Veillonella caviae]|uniref:ShlB/FhaC/HecB family hemolysin secretion/activation protein n=1 Tax=Veillonella caviae TaxID=248316 RepID=UPI002A9182EA|nr:ShlB/FhaC/HecB family hemolysin secretion/activation protein [Veillonella caviae]MDY5481137.1 ShlB/FhaC/HecB family hemolysin secretion/activation protein [Veillonella caviae]